MASGFPDWQRQSEDAWSIVLSSSPSSSSASNVTWTVPAGERWQPVTMRIPFSTGATAANRDVYLHIDDGVFPLYQASPNIAQAANLIWGYSWARGQGEARGSAGASIVVAEMPDMVLLPGWTIQVNVFNFKAGDSFQFSQRFQYRKNLAV